MSLGDTVNESEISEMNKAKQKDKMKSDLFSEETGKTKIVQSKVEEEQGGTSFQEKFKNKTAFGSEDINGKSSGGKRDLSEFEGRSGFGSDDLNGKASSTSNSRQI
jgi:hypothetical protein